MESLELEKKGTKEAFGAKLKKILERIKREREGWERRSRRGRRGERERLQRRGLVFIFILIQI